MLRILALTAALAGPTVDVPILLPQRMPDEFEEYFPTGFGRERSWGLQLGAAEGCGGATACFIASFKGRKGGQPLGARRAELARGRVGRFKPMSCGASCSPPSISWKERGATYSIQAKVGTEATEVRVFK